MKTWLSNQVPLLGLFVVLLCAGCVHPKVTYVKTPENDDTGKIKFRLQATRLVLGEEKVDPQDGKKFYIDIKDEKRAVALSKVFPLAVPREEESALYAIVPQSQWFWTVETKLSVTYFDNTRLIKKIGTQVEDHRIEAVQAVGSLVGAVMKVMAPQPIPPAPPAQGPAEPSIQIPVAIDVEPVIEPAEASWHELPGNADWKYKVDRLTKEADAVNAKDYFTKYKDKFLSLFSSTRTVPISSCRQSYLRLAMKDRDGSYGEKVKWPIQLADYKNVRTYEMPDKGSISAHSLCGADIVTEKSDITSAGAFLSEIVKQAKAIKDAQN